MRHLAATLIIVSTTAFADPPATILSCRMADGTEISITTDKTADGDNYYANYSGKVDRVFPSLEDAAGISSVVLAKCVNNALVFTLETTSPYLQSLIIRKLKNHRFEWFYTADRFPPEWLYQNGKMMILASPTHGLGEFGSKRYVMYRKYVGSAQPKMYRSQSLPSGIAHKFMRLD